MIKSPEDHAAQHAERVRRNIETLRAKMSTKKTLPAEDRPKLVRNLGELIEADATETGPAALTKQVFDRAFTAGGENKLSNRKRYVRFAGEPASPGRVAHGEYAAKIVDFWPIAEAIAALRGGGDHVRWSVLGAMVKGTSFAVSAPTALALSAPSDGRALAELDDVAARIAERTGLAAYFDMLRAAPFWRVPGSGAPRFVVGGDRADFARLNLDDLRDDVPPYERKLIPTVPIGEVCIPFPVLSVDISVDGVSRQDFTKDRIIEARDRINQAIVERFGRMPPGDLLGGGEPTANDPWSLQEYDRATKSWKSNDTSAFWGSSRVQDRDGTSESGRAWRRLYATFDVELSLQPSERGIVFGLATQSWGVVESNDIFTEVTEGKTLSAIEDVANLHLLWRNGPHVWSFTWADVIPDFRRGLADRVAAPFGGEDAAVLLFGQLSKLQDGGEPASWSEIANGPVGFFPNFPVYHEEWAPAPLDSLAGMLLRHFAYSDSAGLEDQLTEAARALVQALNACVEEGEGRYTFAKARKNRDQ